MYLLISLHAEAFKIITADPKVGILSFVTRFKNKYEKKVNKTYFVTTGAFNFGEYFRWNHAL